MGTAVLWGVAAAVGGSAVAVGGGTVGVGVGATIAGAAQAASARAQMASNRAQANVALHLAAIPSLPFVIRRSSIVFGPYGAPPATVVIMPCVSTLRTRELPTSAK